MKTCLVILISLLVIGSSSATFSRFRNETNNTGLQVQELLDSIYGKRIAILTNPSCVDDSQTLVYDILFQNQKKYNYTLEFALAPEHGIRGDQDAGGTIYDYVDPVTNITVYSVYGIRRAPTPEMLSQIDTLIHCILDVGTRFYTFDWTMSYALEAVGNYNYNLTASPIPFMDTEALKQRMLQTTEEISFIVVDRPNVLGGQVLEGCPLELEAGYIGRLFNQNFTIPTRYAMTTGELALLFNYQYLQNQVANLKIIEVPFYTRSQAFPNVKLWVPPSPNMKTFETAYVYPGTGIFEQTNVSEGRGTDEPFQIIGAPFVDGQKIAAQLQTEFNSTATFEPITFVPTTSKWVNQTCQGVRISQVNFTTYQPVLVGTRILQILLNEYPDLVTLSQSGSNRMFGTTTFYDLIRNTTVQEILQGCKTNLDSFQQIRENYLIYPEY